MIKRKIWFLSIGFILALQISLATPGNAGVSDWIEKGKKLILGDSKEGISKKLDPSANQADSGLVILSAAPSEIVDDAGQNMAISVTFDRPMVALEALPSEELPGPLQITPSVKGVYRWLGTNTLVFKPSVPLEVATRYVAMVPAGTTAKDGSKLEKDYQWTFETVRPQFTESNPYHQASFVDIKAPILLTFNMPMDPSRIAESMELRGRPTADPLEYGIAPFQEGDYTEKFAIKVEMAKDKLAEIKNFYMSPGANLKNYLVVRPRGELKKEYTYTLILKEGLLGAVGDLGLLQPSYLQFKTYNNFRVLSVSNMVHPEEPVEVKFSNPVAGKQLVGQTLFTPPLQLPKELESSAYESNSIYLYLKFAPQNNFMMELSGKIKDKFNQKLDKKFSSNFSVTSYVPFVAMPSGLVTVEGYLDHRLPVTAINMFSVRRGLLATTPENAIPLLVDREQSWQRQNLSGMDMDDWKIEGKLDKSAVLPFPLDSKLKSGFGFLFARIESDLPDTRAEDYPIGLFLQRKPSMAAFVQVTNLGVTAKCSPESNLIFVSELKTARPVGGAKVELRDDSGKLLWQGQTDKTGTVLTPGWGLLNVGRPNSDDYYYSNNPRLWIIASRGADKAMVASNWGTGIYPWSFNINYENRQIYPDYAVHVYTDRGLYQAGETVHIKGLYRQRKSNQWIISDLKNVSLRILNSRGEEVVSSTVSISDFGSFYTDFEVSPEAVTGWYSIEVGDPRKAEIKEPNGTQNFLAGSGSFQVEAFRPAKFESTVRLNRESYTIGDKGEGTLRGWYLFGAPMKKAAIDWRMRLAASYFEPEGHPGYTFSPDRSLSTYEGTQGSVLVASGQDKLDDKGELQVRFPIEAKSLSGPLSLQLEGTVTDQDRQTISGRATAVVHPGDYYVGLKLSSSFIEKSKPLKILVIAVTPEGKRIPNEKVAIRIIKREWNSVRKAGVHGRTFWVTETKDTVIKTLQANTAVEPVELTYEPNTSGFYLAQAEAKDRKGRRIVADTYFYATGQDYIAWERSDDDRIELISDRTKYKPGETAKIMVKSPFEKAFALVTLEREGIVHQFTTEVKGSADVISIPLENRFVPNVYVSVVLLQGRSKDNKFSDKGEDVGKPMFKIGYVNLLVDPGTRRLNVTAKTSNKTYKPGQKAQVEIQITDQKGKPVVAECSISVADRGILDLIGYETPDSFNSFYGKKPLSVETVESRLHVIGQRSYGEKGENRGGGGGANLLADMDLRKKFSGSAFWKAAVVTDANGHAMVEFLLPDNLTTFKVMVTAQTKNARFGAGDTQFIVKKPLMLQPSLPRFARLGDTFEAGVVVHNLTGNKGEVLLAGQSSGLTLSGESQKSVILENGQSQEVRFQFEASKLGEAKVTFGGKLGEEKDGFELKIPVILPRMTEAVALYEDTDSKALQTLKIPDNIYPEAGGLHIEAASTALIGLKEGVQYLQAYPHECLEQKISRVLPFVLAEDMLSAFGISDLKGEKRQKILKDIIQQTPRFQRGDGGFGFWTDSIRSSEYLTAFTMFFLHEAKKDGFQPDQKMVERALQYMKSTLGRDDRAEWNYPYGKNGVLCTKSFLVYSLALWGQPEPGYISRLHENLQQIPYFGRALLLKSIPLSGMDKSLGDSIAASLFNSIKIDPTRAHFEEQDPSGLEWNFYSPVQTSAFVLQAMLESGREFPQASKVIRWLMEERKIGRWRSTQENIYVFYGLSEYFRRYEKDEPNFTAVIKIGGKEALTHLFQGRNVALEKKVIPWSSLPMGKEVPVELERQGTGRLYYGLRMIYAPKGILKAREEGLSIQRQITLENGDPLPPVIKAGTKLLVKLTVTTPFDRSFIAIDDWLPAGFQAINSGFATANSEDAATANKAVDNPNDWWGNFNHLEFYDARVGIYADYLSHGTHTTAYMVTAVTPGIFSLPPAMVEGMYTPEVFGRSVGGTIEIK